MKHVLFIVVLMINTTVWAAPHGDAATDSAPNFQTCMFESPDVGKIKFRGNTREDAFEQTSRACLQSRVETFIRKKGETPTVERKILFAEDCVNKTYCKH